VPLTARRELDLERQEIVSAPVDLVWDEMGSLGQVLAMTPYISDYEVVPGGQQAQGRAMVAWGPVKRTIDLDATLLGIALERQIRYVIAALSLQMRVEIAIDLALAGMNETRLHYHSLLIAGHPTTVRTWRLYREIAEVQADRLLHRVKVKSEQRRLAKQRLLDD
jgi:hypothetical protein